MAEYVELRTIFDDATMLNRTDVAIIVSAETLLEGTPTQEETNWAAAAADRTRQESQKALRFVIANNKDLTVEQIRTAPDASLQANVDQIVPTLVSAFNALFVTR